MHSTTILGQLITMAKPEEVKALLRSQLQAGNSYRIATVNPEFLVEAFYNPAFRQSLEQADIRLADGVGITVVAKFLGQPVRSHERCTGVDLTEMLLTMTQEQKLSVLIVYNPTGLTSRERLLQWLQSQYPTLDVSVISADHNLADYHSVAVVLNALGAPEQEHWLNDHFMEFPRAILVGVGGTFDMLSGTIRRAPLVVRRFGFEWLWRLLMQPERRLNRLRRIVRATVVFPWLVITHKH